MLEKEREIYKRAGQATGKPEAVIEKIVNGKMEKFYEENCLYEQHFIKDESVTIGEMVIQAIAKLGENISIRAFRASRSAKSAGTSSAGRILFLVAAVDPACSIFFQTPRKIRGVFVAGFAAPRLSVRAAQRLVCYNSEDLA